MLICARTGIALYAFLASRSRCLRQLDSAQLRVKFGRPLDREVFRVPPGFDLVVDYAPAISYARYKSRR